MSKARDLANAGTALTTVSATELGYLDGVTSAVQTQINSKIGQSTAINPTIVDAKGDILAASAADTVARLAVGANDTVLTADSSTATGLKWATPAAGGMTLISTTTLSGSSVTLSSIPSSYNSLYIVVRAPLPSVNNRQINMRFNADATASRTRAITTYGTTAATLFNGQSFTVTGSTNNTVSNTLAAVFIPDYTNTTTWKMCEYFSVCNDETTTTSFQASAGMAFYNQTGAISSWEIFVNSGVFTSGSVLLYGVK